MKRTVGILLILMFLCVVCSGCDSWMNGEYLSVTPHEAQQEHYADRVIEVTSYTQLRNAVTNLVRTGAENGIISISSFNRGTIHFYVDTAIANAIENTAYGAYAVEEFTYEIGTNRGVSVVACNIRYRSGCHPQAKIKDVGNIKDFSDMIIEALEGMDSAIVVHIEQYETIDIKNLVYEHASQYPDHIIEIPDVSVSVYPDKGAERIIEVIFEYATDRVVLQQMRGKVEEVFQNAEETAGQIDQIAEIYKALYLFLVENREFSDSETATPSYTLMVKGFGDDKAFADVYTRLCGRVGLDAETIAGTRDGIPWVWNSVRIRGEYYYVDLLRCLENHEFQLLTDAQMDGYKWNN